VLHLLNHLLFGPVKAHSGVVFAQTRHMGNVFVVMTIQVQGQHNPINFGQAANGVQQFFIDIVSSGIAGLGVMPFFQAFSENLLFAPKSQHGIERNAVKPGGESGFALECSIRFPSLQQHLLEQIALILRMNDIQADHFVNDATVLLDELDEGLFQGKKAVYNAKSNTCASGLVVFCDQKLQELANIATKGT
jgi:hypothetical protein